MASVEEKVEEYYKDQLDKLKIRHYGKTESVNRTIDDALKNADSKSGNNGNNYPDIKLLLENKTRRNIPVMTEAKGSKGKLEKLTKDGDIELVSGGKNPYSAVMNFAVNGALHYGNAILAEGTYKEVVIVGINGTTVDEDGLISDPEIKAYYVSQKNNGIPKEIKDFDFVWQYMRDRITELERDRITELDAYLQATGLNDYELTDDDKKVLSEKVEWKSFTINDVFEPLKVGFIGEGQKIGSATKEHDAIHCVPLTCAKIGDNGIMYWGKKGDFITYTNALSVIADGAVSAGLVYAQPEEAGAYSHSYFIDTKEKNVSKYAKQFLSSVLTKVIYPKYSREDAPRWNKIESEEIHLPIKSDGTPDFVYMERYIRAMEKVVIADVVKYKDKVIETTKKVVGE